MKTLWDTERFGQAQGLHAQQWILLLAIYVYLITCIFLITKNLIEKYLLYWTFQVSWDFFSL